jgi:hypothetical protein
VADTKALTLAGLEKVEKRKKDGSDGRATDLLKVRLYQTS